MAVDVCVIGSGAGGAVIAARAAAAGRSVALLEEGEYVPPDDGRARRAPDGRRLYKEHGLQTTVDLGMTILQGRALGGTTFVNNAICFRLGDPALRAPRGADVLEDWRALGAAIDEPALQARTTRSRPSSASRSVPDPLVGASGHALLDGWRALDSGGAGVRRLPQEPARLHRLRLLQLRVPVRPQGLGARGLRAAGRAARRARAHRAATRSGSSGAAIARPRCARGCATGAG